MNEAQTLAYVRATAAALNVALDEPQIVRVATHLQRTAAMAELLDAFPLHEADELVEMFCPAPFPEQGR